MKRITLASIVILSLLIASCTDNKQSKNFLQKEFINPGSGYSQVVSVATNNIKTLYISGQIGVGNNLETQMRSALNNLKIQLDASGATYSDIVKMNTYIVNYRPEYLDIFRDVRKEIMGDKDMPASTLVGVQSLATDKWLIEIEATAIVQTND